ncbi:MAG TPA: hypothetical protein VNO32_02525 [Candidatus Acidoferrum sp.]|nr:hypothetical protein [Candidatus Acidoferrum sp.]
MPDRTHSVTFAAILAIFTGLYGLVAYIGVLVWGRDTEPAYSGLRLKLIITFVILGCASIGALIGGFGILFRHNWARVLAIVAAVPLIYSGLRDLYGFLTLPDSLIRSGPIAVLVVTFVLPLLVTIAWVGSLIGKKVRAQFLPPAMVKIYVNLLNKGNPCARPTHALTLRNGLYELLATEGYDPDVEHWEFRPGTIVRGKEERRDGEAYLLATSFGP